MLHIIVTGILCGVMITDATEIVCQRTKKIEHHGYGITQLPLEIDVGKCSLVNATTGANMVCEKNDSNCRSIKCIPDAYNMEQFNDRNGPINVRVIRSCSRQSSCRKVFTHTEYYYPNSKYETKINVAACTGTCEKCEGGEESDCVPLTNVTRSIQGPNGWMTVNVTAECGCAKKKCYRMTNLESFWNYNGNSSEREEMTIDVGKCVGECTGEIIPGICLYRNQITGVCIVSNPSYQAKCVPVAHSLDQYYTNINGERITVPTISECGCSTG